MVVRDWPSVGLRGGHASPRARRSPGASASCPAGGTCRPYGGVLDEMVAPGSGARSSVRRGTSRTTGRGCTASCGGRGLALVGAFCPLTLHEPAGPPALASRGARPGPASSPSTGVSHAGRRRRRATSRRQAVAGRVTAAANPSAEDDLAARRRGPGHAGRRLRPARACGSPSIPTPGRTWRRRPRLDALLGATPPEAAGLCLDTGHLAYGGADPVAVCRRYAGRVWHVHAKDVRGGRAGARCGREGTDYATAVGHGVFAPLGDGDVDFRGAAGRPARAGYGGWIVLEQDVRLGAPWPAQDPAAQRRRSLNHLQHLDGRECTHDRDRAPRAADERAAGQIIAEFLVQAGVPYVAGIPGHGIWTVLDAFQDYRDRLQVVQVIHEQARRPPGGRLLPRLRTAHGRLHFDRTGGGEHGDRRGHRLRRFARPCCSSPAAPIPTCGATPCCRRSSGCSGPTSRACSSRSPSRPGSRRASSSCPSSCSGPGARWSPAGPGRCTSICRWTSRPTPPRWRCRVPRPFCPAGAPVRTRRPRRAPARRLMEAQRPVIVAGGGVILAEAAPELLALAEHLGAPVVTTWMGKGAIPGRPRPQRLEHRRHRQLERQHPGRRGGRHPRRRLPLHRLVGLVVPQGGDLRHPADRPDPDRRRAARDRQELPGRDRASSPTPGPRSPICSPPSRDAGPARAYRAGQLLPAHPDPQGGVGRASAASAGTAARCP